MNQNNKKTCGYIFYSRDTKACILCTAPATHVIRVGCVTEDLRCDYHADTLEFVLSTTKTAYERYQIIAGSCAI